MNDIQDFRKNYLAILKSSKLKQTKKNELFQTILCQMDEIFKIRTSEMEKYNTDNYDAITLYLEISATLKAQQENN
ncbi:MAG: hypothetical protein PWR19_1644 [Carnobacterium sp.]|jgi:predicted metal-dependent peptidase|uniref:hypothetical protein n=1 Tax=Carnobacterium TaxID=2747 RepID=UPI0005571F2D|nr:MULTISPECIES: hypothetical protein [Carnobacterium]MCM3513243.1 hypothetical protein [Carnobacterium inhibens]MDN5372598.1 hypothetical protein [Carnobacterium sp.]